MHLSRLLAPVSSNGLSPVFTSNVPVRLELKILFCAFFFANWTAYFLLFRIAFFHSDVMYVNHVIIYYSILIVSPSIPSLPSRDTGAWKFVEGPDRQEKRIFSSRLCHEIELPGEKKIHNARRLGQCCNRDTMALILHEKQNLLQFSGLIKLL